MFPDGFFSAAGEALLLMIIAAILGGIIVWLLMRSRYETLLGQYNTLTGAHSELENKYKTLLAQHDELKPKHKELQANYDKQGRLLKECGDKRTELDMELTQVKPFKDKYEILQVDHTAKVKDYDALALQFKNMEVKAEGLDTALKEERNAAMKLRNEFATIKTDFDGLKPKYEQVQTGYATQAEQLRKYNELKLSLESSLKAEKEANANLSQQLALLQNQANKPAPAQAAASRSVKKPKETAEETLERIKQKASNINFDRIGIANISDRDDLKRVKGIGPFIEKKLNALGIYTWRQIANFTAEDEDVVNDAIEFFPGRIRRDSWSSQAETFADEKDKQTAENKG